MVSGDIREHKRNECNGGRTCYDCHNVVKGSFKEHHKVCLQNRKSKSEITSSAEGSAGDILKSYTDTKDVYFIVDVSGSMGGGRLDKAKQAIQEAFNALPDNDRMAIVTFDTSPFFKLKPRPVSQLKRQQELEPLLKRIFAQGLTAIYDAIIMAANQIHDKNRITLFNVLTDGHDNSSTNTMDDVRELLSQYPTVQMNIIHIDDERNRYDNYQTLCDGTGGTYNVSNDETFAEHYVEYVHEFYNKYHVAQRSTQPLEPPPAYE